jgi:hypothetical protein
MFGRMKDLRATHGFPGAVRRVNYDNGNAFPSVIVTRIEFGEKNIDEPEL